MRRLRYLNWWDLPAGLLLVANLVIGVLLLMEGDLFGLLNAVIVPVVMAVLTWMTLGIREGTAATREHMERLSRQGGTPWFPATDEERSELRQSLDRKTKNPDWMR